MNKKLSLILFSLIISAVFASFVAISLEDRIKNSELIIIGDLDSIKYKAIDITWEPSFPGTFLDIGYINIHKILFNTFSELDSTKKIPIKMASVKDKWVSSGDISYKIGSFGIWILDYDDKDSLFRAGYPKDSQPIEYENEIRGIIQKLKADSVKINLEK